MWSDDELKATKKKRIFCSECMETLEPSQDSPVYSCQQCPERYDICGDECLYMDKKIVSLYKSNPPKEQPIQMPKED